MPGGSAEKRGYSANFCGQVPPELECPVCLCVMREPHLTSCCGNHFCFSCISEIRDGGNPCPLCKVVITHTLLNRKEKCRILELKVFCTLNDKGCQWTGELCVLESHLLLTKESGPCQFVEVTCPMGCAHKSERKLLAAHLESSCPLRLQTCSYCDHKATGKHLAEHFETCPKYPVICPHLCELSSVPRNKLSAHLEVCPNQPMACPFAKVNCSVKLTRQEFKSHLDVYLQTHLEMVVERLVTMEKRNSDLEQTLGVYEKRIAHLEENVTSSASGGEGFHGSSGGRGVVGSGLEEVEEGLEDGWVSVPSSTENLQLDADREELGGNEDDHFVSAGEEVGTSVDVLSGKPASIKRAASSPGTQKRLQNSAAPSQDILTSSVPVPSQSWSTGDTSPAPSHSYRPHLSGMVSSLLGRPKDAQSSPPPMNRRRWFGMKAPRQAVAAQPPASSKDPGHHHARVPRHPSKILSQLRSTRGIHTIVLPGTPILQLKRGNICNELVECWAAPADPFLTHDGGCAGAINWASKGMLQKLSRQYVSQHGKLATSEAVAFDLNGSLHAKRVICVVGPHVRQFASKKAEAVLSQACTAVLDQAVLLKVSSLALPSISAGLYGMDPKVVAQVLISACLEYAYPDQCSLSDLRLVIYDPEVYAVFEKIFLTIKAGAEEPVHDRDSDTIII